MAKATDKKTLELMNEVKSRKAEISKTEKHNWLTNCSFSMTGKSNDAINLHVTKDVSLLLACAALLLQLEESYTKAATMLNVEEPPAFKWAGFTVSEWITDMKVRIAQIQIDLKRRKLERLEDSLSKIISPELKAQMVLEEVSKELA